jgi:predicted kinase
MTRKILWEMNYPHDQRELICNLIAYHQIPFFLIEKNDYEARKIAHKISSIASNELLAIVSEADIRGRKCQDLQKVLDNISLFKEVCLEEKCLYDPKIFGDDHSRFIYFSSENRLADYEIYDDFSENYVYVMSGLPGSGKDHYIKNNFSYLPIISLDDLRDEFDIDSEDNQGKILQEAKERAKQFLRKKESFVWNATNINKQRRDPILGMIHDYRMKSHIVYIETSKEKLLEQNKNRKNKVPIRVIDKMSSKWEPPTLLECHKLTKVIS